jgi:glycosylphosphatidylinositol transamidase (GPIT) subunit GPI8
MNSLELKLALCLFLINLSHSSEPDKGVTWALLVAGSNGFFNYRHQVLKREI